MALFDENRCRVCGCTDDRACAGGCYWVNSEHDLCSACVRKVMDKLYCPACIAKSGIYPPCESEGACCYDLSDIPELNGTPDCGGERQ